MVLLGNMHPSSSLPEEHCVPSRSANTQFYKTLVNCRYRKSKCPRASPRRSCQQPPLSVSMVWPGSYSWRFFLVFFPFSSVFSLFSFRFLPFFSVFFPFFSVSFSEKNGETPFARTLLRNADETVLSKQYSRPFPSFGKEVPVMKCQKVHFHFATPYNTSEVNKRGRPSKWPPECLPSKFADFECAFSL